MPQHFKRYALTISVPDPTMNVQVESPFAAAGSYDVEQGGLENPVIKYKWCDDQGVPEGDWQQSPDLNVNVDTFQWQMNITTTKLGPVKVRFGLFGGSDPTVPLIEELSSLIELTLPMEVESDLGGVSIDEPLPPAPGPDRRSMPIQGLAGIQASGKIVAPKDPSTSQPITNWLFRVFLINKKGEHVREMRYHNQDGSNSGGDHPGMKLQVGPMNAGQLIDWKASFGVIHNDDLVIVARLEHATERNDSRAEASRAVTVV